MTALACDVGATRIKMGIVHQGQVLAQDVMASQSDQGLEACLPALALNLRRLCSAQGIRVEDCAGLSMSLPSLVDARSGRVLAEYGRFRDMPKLDLRAWAKTEFNLPLAIENDARMATIGEWQYGSGRGCNDLVMITLGTGLGTSTVIDGRILRGRHGQAGCLGGHLTPATADVPAAAETWAAPRPRPRRLSSPNSSRRAPISLTVRWPASRCSTSRPSSGMRRPAIPVHWPSVSTASWSGRRSWSR
jgi:predicted NBD/HSP70 family sugar kinase